MSHTTNESDDFVFSKDQTESALAEDGCSNGNGNGGIVLKKGPWTAAEDAILIDYVKKHGEGNWNAVQKNSGLSRCGKSCRLRWANHLRPNLKKGAFTQEEEQLIIELHAKMGNKWARMATYLHGRTDNEIKNYWNTRIKRRQRAGLPLYPPEVSLQAMQENQPGLNIGEINTGDRGPHDFLQHNNFEIPDVVFDSLKANQGYYPYAPQLPDVTQTGMLLKGLGSSQYNGFMMHRQKRLRESETMVPNYGGCLKDGFPLFDQFSFQFENENQGCHTLANGDFSASGSCSGPVKLELPSLQYPESDLGIWGTAPSPFLETVGNFIQSPPPVESSPRNSGLLDALIQSSGKNHYSDKSSNSSTVTPGELAETSGLNNVYDTEWEEYGDPIAPLGQNATSLFSTPSGSSLEEVHPADAFTGCNVKLELDDRAWSPQREETSIQFDSTHPDALLAADWLGPGSEYIKDQSVMTNDVATLLGDNLTSDDNLMPAGSSPEQNPGRGLGCCAWNVMPGVCQISELP